MSDPRMAPMPTAMNARPFWPNVKPRFTMKMMGKASKTGKISLEGVLYYFPWKTETYEHIEGRRQEINRL